MRCGPLSIRVFCIVVGLVIAADAGEDSRERQTSRLSRLSLRDLAKRLDSLSEEREAESDVEVVLVELTRRGGKEVEKLLVEQLQKRRKRRFAAEKRLKTLKTGKDDDAISQQYTLILNLSKNLHFLTALRRVQKKPDPLVIEVKDTVKLNATTRRLPMVSVALRSADIEKTPVWIREGGNNRSGRQARWRFEVRDSTGKLLPTREIVSFIGGGLSTQGFLRFGERWKTVLNMNRFVRIPNPGKYTVRLHYHNTATIVDVPTTQDLKNYIVSSSKSFKLNVTKHPKRVIQLRSGSRRNAEALLRQLNAAKRVKIVGGKYDKSFHSFVPPKSAPGQLLQMKWQAVPVLLEKLVHKNTSLRKRAWILSLLYSISGEDDLDPTTFREGNVLPDYILKYSTGGQTKIGGSISRKHQMAFINRWVKFRKEYLEIKEAP